MFRKPTSATGLDDAINRVLLAMKEKDPTSDEYAKLVDRLSKLNEIKVNHTKTHLSRDTLATIGAHIAGIVLILQYERVNVVGTRALTFVQKLR